MKTIKSWDNYNYKLTHEVLINEKVISESIDNFWDKIVTKIKDDHHLLIIFRIKTSNNYLTLGQLQKLNLNDKEYFKTYVLNIFNLKDDSYKILYINQVTVSYGIREGKTLRTTIQQTSNFQNYRHYKLPITMNAYEYGYIIFESNDLYIIEINTGTIATIKIKYDKEGKQSNHVSIHRNKMLILDYKDVVIDRNKFKRVINKNTYIYKLDSEDNQYKLDLFTVEKPVRFINPKKKDIKQNNKIITLDIETFKEEGGLVPYLISWFDGQKHQSYFLSDFESSQIMIKKALLDLRRAKYHNHKIYVHNLAGFDAFFIIKELANIGILTPIIHEGKIISLKLIFSNSKNTKSFSLLILDSLHLLLSSLKKLCKAFDLEIDKGLFPHNFINRNNLNYIGTIPSYEFYKQTSYEDYLKYKNDNQRLWSLRDEAIKYCERDCLTLYQVISKFNDLMFNNLNIDMTKYPTISSLAMGLFRMHYINEDSKISMISGQIYNHIKQSYTGGSTDMFIPSNNSGELIYGYDVNSLYPFVMANLPLPVGKPVYFEGDILKHNSDAFGFFYCKIKTPDHLDHPILQLHVKTKNNAVRTIAGLGEFETMLFSEEINNAMKLGYTFEILWGYTFDRGYIFKEFIDSLYSMRLSYSKDHPMNYIAKILMNSLYGKFGMNDLHDECMVIDKESFYKLDAESNNLTDVIELGDHFIIKIERDQTSTLLDNASETHNVNIGIASAITAYARIYMSQFKNNPNLKLYYTDTDSIYTNLSPDQMNELFASTDAEIISNKGLGKLKLESINQKAVFLAPKVYYLKTNENLEITKVKGLKKDIKLTEKEFESLLFKDSSIIKSQEKWYRSLEQIDNDKDVAPINIKLMEYTVKQTDNKRELIFDSNRKLVGTKPYIIDKDKII